MIDSNDYILFVISWLMIDLFNFILIVLVLRYVIDMYFLHQREKTFTVLKISLLSRFLVTSTLEEFIADSRSWSYVFWWLVIVNDFAALLDELKANSEKTVLTVYVAFAILEETSFEREKTLKLRSQLNESYLTRRVALFLLDTAIVSRTIVNHMMSWRFMLRFNEYWSLYQDSTILKLFVNWSFIDNSIDRYIRSIYSRLSHRAWNYELRISSDTHEKEWLWLYISSERDL